jgi:3-oxoacyl-[acyl-carrier protein] reductase
LIIRLSEHFDCHSYLLLDEKDWNFAGKFGEKLVVGTPLGRFGKPEDIAPLAVFLASEDSHWVTGESIRASGGVRRVGY